MADISQVKIPGDTVYNIKDTFGRRLIDTMDEHVDKIKMST